MHGLYANTMPFCIRDLSILGFWYSRGLGGSAGLGTTPSQILRKNCASEHWQSWRMNFQRSELRLLSSQQLLRTKYFLPGPTSTLDLGLASSKYIVVYEFKIGDWLIPVWYIVAGSLWGEKSQPMMNMPFQMFSNSETLWCFTEFVRSRK